MTKIIEVTNINVTLGLDNGGIKEVRLIDLNFTPQIGDEVEIFESESRTIVSKVVKPNEYVQKPTEHVQPGGVNVNVQNTVNPSYPQYAGSGSKIVNKVVYILLALFLGGIGAHKFYAGKIGTGVVFLLFFWTGIPSIIAFIDLVIAIFKKSDYNGNIVI